MSSPDTKPLIRVARPKKPKARVLGPLLGSLLSVFACNWRPFFGRVVAPSDPPAEIILYGPKDAPYLMPPNVGRTTTHRQRRYIVLQLFVIATHS